MQRDTSPGYLQIHGVEEEEEVLPREGRLGDLNEVVVDDSKSAEGGGRGGDLRDSAGWAWAWGECCRRSGRLEGGARGLSLPLNSFDDVILPAPP